MRCRHCGVEIRPSIHGHWSGPDGVWTCEGVPQGLGGTNHEPVDGPVTSVNVGRLNVNVGRLCQRCDQYIAEGQRSERRWVNGEIHTYHLNPVCHRRRDERGRFAPPPQPTTYGSNYSWTTVGQATTYTTTGTSVAW